eukprot:m.409889 g.409889  ORF g.409889 m.409889 type:complete len:82 (+) comp16804_c0_seq7:1840-2085(+)
MILRGKDFPSLTPQHTFRTPGLHQLLILHVAHWTSPTSTHRLHTHITVADALMPTREAGLRCGAVEADRTIRRHCIVGRQI